ncbi:MAG: asparagine synthase (glutamine-hydrolyzing) [Deltaproteobacteria bacterium]|nr:asparagine synthase (glutamine-hydrolyzing) [Deltaproteobacteria bacterium]
MCGICGLIWDRGNSYPGAEPLVREMMRRQAHRGPDGQGLISGPGFCFGHRRLAVIDLTTGSQPMTSPDGRYALTYNGEIYNYIELREELLRAGTRFRTSSDTEVLLHLLIQKGDQAFNELNGMFAFAFIDRLTGVWLLARDLFGIKPLYYASIQDEIIFASEIKAILAHSLLPAAPDWSSLQQYLTFQFCLNGQTLFSGIRALEPGHYIRGRQGRITESGTYWEIDHSIDDSRPDEYWPDKLRAYLEDSVSLQLRSHVPVGAHLSGGLDSSAVAALAAKRLDHPLPVFHGRFSEGAAYDESAYAQAVARFVGGEYHEVVPSAEDFVDWLPRLIYYLDEPVAGPGVFPQFMVSRLAAGRVKVVLGGQGGDEIFCGYARYLIAYLEQAMKAAIFDSQEEGAAAVSLVSLLPGLPLLKSYRGLMDSFWREGLFDDMAARYFKMIDRSPDLADLLTPDACHRMDRGRIFADFCRVFNQPNTSSYINKMALFDLKTLLPALLQVEDRVSMAVSLESRVPLLDRRIVELMAAMPPALKFNGGAGKNIFKQAMADVLPRQVLHRQDKMGFPVPLKEWMTKGPVRDFVHDVLGSQSCRDRGLVQGPAVARLLDQESTFGRQLWGILCLELWHRQFIDQGNQ